MKRVYCKHCGSWLGYEDAEVRMRPFPHITCPVCKIMVPLF